MAAEHSFVHIVRKNMQKEINELRDNVKAVIDYL